MNPVIPGRLKAYLHIYHEAGAIITSNVVDRALKGIKQTHKPIVLLWFGTCELTKKVGNLVKIRNSPYQNTEFTLTNYREKKSKRKQVNRTAKIIFIECPYYSVDRWNSTQRRQKPKLN